jgi:hypothetical protein
MKLFELNSWRVDISFTEKPDNQEKMAGIHFTTQEKQRIRHL